MNRVAWLTCALLSVVGARIYERCELARELESLGVHPDDISTWVCIAYHESRFDTAANNPHSGDHGIFQISQLYWCGPGKACGLPCSALRDEDISDDLECALIVHEEHTRLQGNGFLAWVVYPQHCKHNTKKYLVDCDTNVKSSVPITRSRGYNYVDRYDEQNVTTFRQNTNNALPSFLSIAAIVRENYGRISDPSRGRLDWTDYKIDNIDELKLPVLNQPSQHINVPPATFAPRPTTTTTTTTTTYIPPVKPWRTIETNQFRKKHRNGDIQKTTKYYDIGYDRYYTQSTASVAATARPIFFASSTAVRNVTTTTTLRPTTKSTTVTTTTWRPPTTTTTYRPPTTTTTYRPPTTTTYRPPTTTTTYRPPTTTYRAPTSTTTRAPSTTTTYRPITSSTYSYKFPSSTTTIRTLSPFSYKFPAFTSTIRPSSSSAKTTWNWHFTTTTPKPSTTSIAPRVATTTYKPVTTTTQRPTTRTTAASTTARTPWTWPAFTQRSTTSKEATTKAKTDFSWYTFTSRTSTTPATTKLQTVSTKTTPFSFWTKAQSTLANTTQDRTTKTSTYSTVKLQTTTTQKPTTQSIFDLYLNPTKRPQLPSYSFSWGQPKLQIFGSGTTTAATVSRGQYQHNKNT
ncbi:mucin-2-like [Spodoptera litura]|uniref:Lysozyme n=1 Tax=Spodoptera litura TaxID=69820 RepID=A0A9J7EL52_SPOLT|nr:mucin-2-like [Spodoptera litura]